MEKIGRRELCAADFRFDPENRVQIWTHTHTHRLFLGLFIRHGQIYAPGTSSAPNQEARGREAKTESAPRKNSLGPTIKLQGEPETERRFRTPPVSGGLGEARVRGR